MDQPRPTAIIPGLDVHGYPHDPWGRAYPSAHTAVVVGVVAALWPWMNRYQRAAGLALAVLVPLNRIYIGAHWPVDVVGGVAIGMLAASATWLVAVQWPIRAADPARYGPRRPDADQRLQRAPVVGAEPGLLERAPARTLQCRGQRLRPDVLDERDRRRRAGWHGVE